MASENQDGKKQNLKVSKLLSDLNSGVETKVASAIKSFEVHGNAGVIEPLVNVWREGLSAENEKLIIELFEGLKDTSTIDPLMEIFRKEDSQQMRKKLITAFWNSKLDFSPFLADFVLFAIEGDFLDAFEAITLIEQFESSIPESAIMESQLLLKEYFGNTEKRDEQKDVLLGDVALMIKQFDEETDSDDIAQYVDESE